MSVTINLPAETEQKLREAASRRGQSLEAYLEWLVAIQSKSNVGRPAAERTRHDFWPGNH